MFWKYFFRVESWLAVYREAVTPQSPGLLQPGKEQFAENFNPERVATGHRKGFRLGRTLEERRNRLAVEIAYLRFPRVEATLGFGPSPLRGRKNMRPPWDTRDGD